MMHIITADGCAWVAATSIVSVSRTRAEMATIRLENGDVVASLEPYAIFVERLNATLRAATGAEADREPETRNARAPTPGLSHRSAGSAFLPPGTRLGPALP